MHSLPGSALTTFPCNFDSEKNFLRPGGARAPSAPPGYAYVFRLSVRVCVSDMKKFVSTVSYKPLVGISPNLQLWCNWGRRRTDLIRKTIDDNSWNAWRHFNETYKDYSLSGPHDTGDSSIFKDQGHTQHFSKKQRRHTD